MTELQPDSRHLKSDLKKLRILLTLLTLFEIGYMIIVFTDTKLWMKLDFDYKVNWIFWGFHFIVTGIFIWYIRKKMPVEKKVKNHYTFLILFLGIIGMWLWLPNKQELNELTEK